MTPLPTTRPFEGTRPLTAILLSVIAAVTLAGAAIRAEAAPRAIRIKLGTIAPRDHAYHNALKKMAQEWQQISDGAVRITIYAGGTQGGEDAMVQRMQNGQLQAALISAVGLSEIENDVAGLQNLPMMFRDLNEVDYVGEKMRPVLEPKLASKGYVVLFWVDTGWVRFFSKDPVTYPDDLKKLKLFTWAGNAAQVDIMKKAGFTPVPLETSDILASLNTGLIEAAPAPPFFALAGQIYTKAPFMIDLNWAPLVGAGVVTKSTWEEIPDGYRERFMEVARRTGAEIKAAARKEMDESVAIMKDKWGLKVQPVTPEVDAAWRKAAEAVYPDIRGRIVPADVFDKVEEILKEYRAGTGR